MNWSLAHIATFDKILPLGRGISIKDLMLIETGNFPLPVVLPLRVDALGGAGAIQWRSVRWLTRTIAACAPKMTGSFWVHASYLLVVNGKAIVQSVIRAFPLLLDYHVWHCAGCYQSYFLCWFRRYPGTRSQCQSAWKGLVREAFCWFARCH